MRATGMISLNRTASMAAPELFLMVTTRRLSRCLKTIDTALALGRTFSLTAEMKSEDAVPLDWSDWTENRVGSPSVPLYG